MLRRNLLARIVNDVTFLILNSFQCLRDFEISHPKAVGKLRELGNNARALEALSKTRALAEFGGTTTADDISADMGVDPSLLRTIEERVEEVGIVAAHADGFNGEDVQMMRVSAGELKVKHDEVRSVQHPFSHHVDLRLRTAFI